MSSESRRPISRRAFLRGTFGMSLGATLAGILTACGETNDGEAPDAQAPLEAGISAAPNGTPRPLYAPDPTATQTPTRQAGPTPTATPEPTAPLQVLSGWEAELTAPLVEQFSAATGREVEVTSGDSNDLAAGLLAGEIADIDLFLARDAGVFGPLADAGLLAPLPDALRAGVETRFQAAAGDWIGVSGRALVFLYNSDRVNPDRLPAALVDLAQPHWRTLLGWAPASESFGTLVAALAEVAGVEAAEDWLSVTLANRPGIFDGTAAVARAIAKGEIAAGLVEHTDLLALSTSAVGAHWLGEVESYDPRRAGDPGALVAVRCAAVVRATAQADAATDFIAFLLAPETQAQLSELTAEYPLLDGVAADARLMPLRRIQTPAIDLGTLLAGDVAKELLHGIGGD